MSSTKLQSISPDVTLTGGGLSISAPPAGEMLTIGQSFTIKWSVVDLGGNLTSQAINISFDGGITFSSLAASLPASQQSYTWTVPNMPTTQARIQIVALDNSGHKFSSTIAFTIAAGTGTAPQLTSVQPNQVQSGTNVTLVATGANLPIARTSYSVVDSGGNVSSNFVFNTASGSSTSVTLGMSVAPGTSPGQYSLRAAAGTAYASIPLSVVSTNAPQITSIQPTQAAAGTNPSVVLTGSNLATTASSYQFVDSTGNPVAGVQVVSASGASSQVTLQLQIASTAPAGT